MIEYAKVILPEVGYSKDLFKKELIKCIGWIDPKDISLLYVWCHKKFSRIYPDIIAEVFAIQAA